VGSGKSRNEILAELLNRLLDYFHNLSDRDGCAGITFVFMVVATAALNMRNELKDDFLADLRLVIEASKDKTIKLEDRTDLIAWIRSVIGEDDE
jgi:hypothetical protein